MKKFGRRAGLAAALSALAAGTAGVLAFTPLTSIAVFNDTAAVSANTVSTKQQFCMYANQIDARDPARWYRLGESTGSTVAADSANASTVEGTVTTGSTFQTGAAVSCDTDTAITLNGTSGQVYGKAATSWASTYTIEGWIKTSATTAGTIAQWDSSTSSTVSNPATSGTRRLWMQSNGQVQFTSGSSTIFSPLVYNDNTWHHVSASVGAEGMKLFIDGFLAASNASIVSSTDSTGQWRLGNGANGFFNGSLDEMAFYKAQVAPPNPLDGTAGTANASGAGVSACDTNTATNNFSSSTTATVTYPAASKPGTWLLATSTGLAGAPNAAPSTSTWKNSLPGWTAQGTPALGSTASAGYNGGTVLAGSAYTGYMHTDPNSTSRTSIGWVRQLDATDGSGNATALISGTQTTSSLRTSVVCYRGASLAYQAGNAAYTSGTSVTVPTVTAPGDGMVVYIASANSTSTAGCTFSSSTSLTSRGASSGSRSSAVFDRKVAATGAISGGTITSSCSGFEVTPFVLVAGKALTNETFSNSVVDDPVWKSGATETGALPCLTAKTGSGSALPNCTGSPSNEVSGAGTLRMIPNQLGVASYVAYDRPISSGQGLVTTFDLAMTGASLGAGDFAYPADGAAFFLYDGSTTLTRTGQAGHGLGYTQGGSDCCGMGIANAVVGVGFDTYGNFPSNYFWHDRGCPNDQLGYSGQMRRNNVSIRGGSLDSGFVNGYCLLYSSIDRSTAALNTTTNRDEVVSPRGLTGNKLHTDTRANAPTVKVFVTPAPSSRVVTWVDFKDGYGFQEVASANLTTVPNSVKFGVTAGTGGASQLHELRNVRLATF